MAVRKPTKPRKHAVKAEIQNIELTKASTAMTLTIMANKERLGELVIGRGAIYWTGAHRHTSKRISWTAFADMMNKLAYKEDR